MHNEVSLLENLRPLRLFFIFFHVVLIPKNVLKYRNILTLQCIYKIWVREKHIDIKIYHRFLRLSAFYYYVYAKGLFSGGSSSERLLHRFVQRDVTPVPIFQNALLKLALQRA